MKWEYSKGHTVDKCPRVTHEWNINVEAHELLTVQQHFRMFIIYNEYIQSINNMNDNE